jgi:hypothetical protein
LDGVGARTEVSALIVLLSLNEPGRGVWSRTVPPADHGRLSGSRRHSVDCVRDDVPVPAEGVGVYEGMAVSAAVTVCRAFAVMSVDFVAPVGSSDQPVSV